MWLRHAVSAAVAVAWFASRDLPRRDPPSTIQPLSFAFGIWIVVFLRLLYVRPASVELVASLLLAAAWTRVPSWAVLAAADAAAWAALRSHPDEWGVGLLAGWLGVATLLQATQAFPELDASPSLFGAALGTRWLAGRIRSPRLALAWACALQATPTPWSVAGVVASLL